MTTLPPHLLTLLLTQANSPGLPSTNPTISYWQLPPHPSLHSVQSLTLPSTTDYAIIGSGITGLSIAKTLLEHPNFKNKSDHVTVFEARTLCSGASGRNGGGLAAPAPYSWSRMCAEYGKDEAVRIARFMYANLERMYELAEAEGEVKKASEVRRTREVMGFGDVETFEEMRDEFLAFERDVPEANLRVEVWDDVEEARKQFGIKTTGGLLRFNSGAFWPYRFIATYWSLLLQQYPLRLSIETNTPVTDITYDVASRRYILQTPRGIVLATKVFHATNGYAGHLLPGLRGKLLPVRGYMSAHTPGSAFGNFGHERTWSLFGNGGAPNPPTNEQESKHEAESSSIYYGNQSPSTGTLFWGSDLAPLDGILTSDDSFIPPITRKDLETVLPKQFDSWTPAEAQESKSRVKEMWSGIQGYTPDHLPMVGKLSIMESGREGEGEIVCAGFNGAGMSQCWSAGEAAVGIALGEDEGVEVPRSYLVTKERMERERMRDVQKAVEAVLAE